MPQTQPVQPLLDAFTYEPSPCGTSISLVTHYTVPSKWKTIARMLRAGQLPEITAMSGWLHSSNECIQVAGRDWTNEVLQLYRVMRLAPEAHRCDQGVVGQFNACHAEKQLIAYFIHRHLFLSSELQLPEIEESRLEHWKEVDQHQGRVQAEKEKEHAMRLKLCDLEEAAPRIPPNSKLREARILVSRPLLEAWVALKIEKAETSIPSPELLNLQSIPQHTGPDCVAHLIDSFVHEGPNGSHQCTVTELLGPTIDTVVADYHAGGERLDPDIILKITKQLLEAICSLHQAGYAHGDLSGANVVFTASQLSQLSEDALFDIVGHPESAALVRIDGGPVGDGMPKQLIRSTSWDEWVDEDEEDIRLIDWGESFKHGQEPARLAQPGDLKAPEIIFTGHFDHRIDLWRAGCIIYTLLFAARPFQYLGDDAVLIAQMIGFVEELPQQWRQEWEVIQTSATRPLIDIPQYDGANLHQASKLQSRFYALVYEPELMPLLPIIHGLMRFLPSERLTAAEALKLLG
ncbi:hypothetical protein EsDP_00005972 [Epichloe bromicola]|uniref:Protein kinase domain-containing protein n=1 Tax=Epichloe bromicola TaxID=79588 RepID=A0ABQ0CW93_9HYPO